jgi:hypothetical protein
MPKIPPDQLPPESLERTRHVRVTPRFPATNIAVVGNRDPRGADNNIRVWLDADDCLHIRVEKAHRCYSFARLVNTNTYIEVIQD